MAAVLAPKRSFATMAGEGRTSRTSIATKDMAASAELSKSSRVSPQGSASMTNPRPLPAIVTDHAATAPRNLGLPSMSPQSSQAAPLPHEMRRHFHPDASIALIGLRGTGKSTLAVIASMAYRRPVVEIDDLFEQATGFSPARYRKQFGAANHNLRQDELLRGALHTYDQGAIIVCNGGSLERNGQRLMRDFARTHVVIHVVRDLQSVHRYLEGVDRQRLREMMAFSAPILRRCSHYEFYNLPETNDPNPALSVNQPVPPAFLTLQKVQRTFLKFLSLIKAGEIGPRRASVPRLDPGYPLSDIATELRKYTYAVQVPVEDLLVGQVEIGRLENGCDVFEAVIDPRRHALASSLDALSSAISRIRRNTIVPIVYQVLPMGETGGDQHTYLEHVQHGLRLVPEYATIDLSLDHDALTETVASRGVTKMIGCLHADRPWKESFWATHYEHAMRIGCALVRFSRPSHSVDDDESIQDFKSQISKREHQIPLVCFHTGSAGRRSQCFNQHLTPVVPNAKSAGAPRTSDGLLTAKEITQALFSSYTFDPMQFYILGARVEYTVSSIMHNAAYATCGMPHVFNRLPTRSSLSSLKEFMQTPDFGGAIVIQPYRLEVMSLVDSLSQHARAIGAVNTVIPVRHLNPDGSVPGELELCDERCRAGPTRALYADNTEWIGVRACVRRGLSPANAVRPTTCGLVIGAGGMARAVVYALLQLGVCNIAIFNRTYSRAKIMVDHFSRVVSTTRMQAVSSQMESKVTFHILRAREETWPKHFRDPTIIVSCIPPDPIDERPAAHFTLPPQWMASPTGGVVLELAYKTLNTPLGQQIRNASSNLWTYMDGLDFIPEQAFPQFELFTGRRAPRRVMREWCLRAWRDEQGNEDKEMVEKRIQAIGEEEPLAH